MGSRPGWKHSGSSSKAIQPQRSHSLCTSAEWSARSARHQELLKMVEDELVKLRAGK